MQHLWGKAPYREGSKTVPPVAGAGGSLPAGAGAAFMGPLGHRPNPLQAFFSPLPHYLPVFWVAG
ncbi:MAG: hypothetical protein KME26_24695 [Oscillatoria princeps RMCB-10]|nr:hypothetical protein [Oscillatoria princeps RMCB-10]